MSDIRMFRQSTSPIFPLLVFLYARHLAAVLPNLYWSSLTGYCRSYVFAIKTFQMWKIFLQPFKRQILYGEESGGLRVSIRVRRQDPLFYTFLAIWLSAWTVFGIKGIDRLLENTPAALPLWPLGWAFGEIAGVVVALFLIGGSEVVTITPDFVEYRRQIFGVGWTRQYFLHEVLNLRYQLPLGRRPGRLVFDYEGRTLRLVSDVDDAEAVELLSRIRQKMRDYGA